MEKEKTITDEEINMFWNYSRVVSTIPEKAFKKNDPNLQQFMNEFFMIREKYIMYLSEVNSIQDRGKSEPKS